MALDPVTLAILKGRLEQIADEMDATLFRSAFNPITAEAHDATHARECTRQHGQTFLQKILEITIFPSLICTTNSSSRCVG